MNGRVLAAFVVGFGAALAGGWLAFPRALYRAVDQPIQFSHAIHTGEKVGSACSDCHALGDDGRFVGLPPVEVCAGCHAEPLGDSPDEKRLVEEYVKPGREIPWLVYARQPENVFFSHSAHIRLASLSCERCHGSHGKTDSLRPIELNRLTAYSRDVDGGLVTLARDAGTMKMDDCARCHRDRGVREGCLTCHK